MGVSVLCLPPPVFRALVNQEFSWTPLCHCAWLLFVTPKGPRITQHPFLTSTLNSYPLVLPPRIPSFPPLFTPS